MKYTTAAVVALRCFALLFPFDVGKTAGEVFCPIGWWQSPVDGNCYKLMTDEKSWYDAELDCQRLENGAGHLASITSNFESALLSSLVITNYTQYVGYQFWIGAHDFKANYTYQWTDGHQFAYANWAPGQPVDSFDQHCAEATLGTARAYWVVLQCHFNNIYFCESSPVNVTCPPGAGWAATANACFNIYQSATDWVGAEKFCNTLNLPGSPIITRGHLASIHDINENLFVFQEISFLGATSSPICDSNVGYYWIGFRANNTGPSVAGILYSWSDDSDTTGYNNMMNPEYPPINIGETHCGQMGDNSCQVTNSPSSTPINYIQGQWYLNYCNATLPFVCKISVPQP